MCFPPNWIDIRITLNNTPIPSLLQPLFLFLIIFYRTIIYFDYENRVIITFLAHFRPFVHE